VRFAALVFVMALAGCAQEHAVVPSPSNASGATRTASKIQHVVIIFQENRTVDNLFQGLPGADTAQFGKNSRGQRVKLQPIDMTAPYDLGHSHYSFVTERAGNKWNGFDKVSSTCFAVTWCIPRALRAYGYVPRTEVEPYFDLATRYAFADRMFQTNQGPSFPAHQYIISGTSTIANGSIWRAAENPSSPMGVAAGGCDSPPDALVALIGPTGDEAHGVFPCFNRIALMDLLSAKSLTWRYYQAVLGAGLWNGPNAILHIRENRRLNADVIAPSSVVLTDIAKRHLANVVWVTPTAFASDHSASTNGTGPSWVAAVVNAIGRSPYWNSTAIFVTWDDWGGWFDHVIPPRYNSYELSFRVPLIVISPYAKSHYVSHVRHEYGSILKFVEKVFGLSSLGTTDVRSDDLVDCFDFSKQPMKFEPIRAPFSQSYFLRQPPDTKAPDDDF
jgi:phospholipase C